MSYLVTLADRLTTGLQALDEQRRARHRSFLTSQQMPDGGFRGREGDSDLYYTGFAIRGLAVLGGLADDEAIRVARFLRSFDVASLDVIDLLSWLYSALVVQATTGDDLLAGREDDWIDRTVERFERLRRADGGYAKSTEGAIGSTYHAFLISLVYELLGREAPASNLLIQFLYDQQRDDGGFVEIGPMKRSGTNPTAAAAALLNKLGAMDEEVREDVAHFLGTVWTNEGGFAANTRIPFADGLSTFTALLTATDLGHERLIRPDAVRGFLTNELEFPSGGFRGAVWDDRADVEYSFYGLGALALIGP
ncbi:MAG: prenyltransferase/squalene oxidase repeat-containing protein [Planctomycetaceae bacterium]